MDFWLWIVINPIFLCILMIWLKLESQRNFLGLLKLEILLDLVFAVLGMLEGIIGQGKLLIWNYCLVNEIKEII